MTPEEKAKEFNSKLEGLQSSIDGVKAEAKANGELSSGMKEKLSSLEAKFAETEKGLNETLSKAQGQIDDLEVKLKKTETTAEGNTKLHLTIEQNLDGIKNFQSGNASKFGMEIKANMLNSTHSGDVVEQARLAGVFHAPDRQAHVRDIMRVSNFSTETLRYVQETAFTNNVGQRAEGSAISTESDITLTEQTASPSIISSFFNVSKESLSDISYLENHIRTRGMSKLMLQEDQQVLYGTGAGNQLSGITTNATAYSDALADSNVQRFDILAQAVTQAVDDEYKPNYILLHPTDYDKLVREKDGNAAYIYPSAFLGTAPVAVYGARVIASTAVTAGDFIVGDFSMGAELAIRQDVTVEFSREHSSNFTSGLATVLIEERVALPIYRTGAFIYGDFATALAEGTS